MRNRVYFLDVFLRHAQLVCFISLSLNEKKLRGMNLPNVPRGVRVTAEMTAVIQDSGLLHIYCCRIDFITSSLSGRGTSVLCFISFHPL